MMRCGYGEQKIFGKRLVFLVGAPRGGTTWLQLMLASSESVVTTNESHLFSAYTTSLFDSWRFFRSNAREIGIHHFINEQKYCGLVREFAAGVMAEMLALKPEANVILDKTPDHVMRWRDILKVFPDAYFLHLVRDPRSVVASLLAAEKSWGAQWASPRIIDNTNRWIYSVKEGREISKQAENYLEVRYEDLKMNGQQTLSSIFSWMGIERSLGECEEVLKSYSIDKLQSSAVKDTPWSLAAEPKDFYRRGEINGWAADLSPIQVRLVELMTEEMMPVFGYRPASSSGGTWHQAIIRSILAAEQLRIRVRPRLRRVANLLFPRR